MIPVEEAQQRILSAFTALPPESVAVTAALGRVLAADLAARVTQPPKDVSAMDGYAVRAADVERLPASLAVVAEIPAGQSYGKVLAPGEAARIFTGAPLPAGADCIVIQEDTEAAEGRVTVKEAPPPGKWIRKAGLDFTAGDIGLEAGRCLGVRDIALAASMNHPWVPVHRRARIAILATGDEVVMPGEPLGENQIVSSNGIALAAFVEACGGEAVNLGIATDDRETLERLAKGAEGMDLLVTSGGASVGEHDLIRSVLGEQGLELDFWKIAMRPGKPLMFGRLGATPLLGLPGNPVSTLVCALIFLKPVLDRLHGMRAGDDSLETVPLDGALEANDRRQDYLRARLVRDESGRERAQPFSRQDSSMLSRLARADCLILRRPHAEPCEAGQNVDIIRFSQAAQSAFL